MTSSIVKKWIEVDKGLMAIISNSTEADLSVSKAMLLLGVCKKNYNESKARQYAHQVYEQEKDCDKELFGLFILLWAFIAINHKNYIEGRELINRFDSMAIVIPEFVVFANTAKAFLQSLEGNQYLREKISKSSIKILGKDSAHYERAFLSYGQILSMGGRLKEIEAILSDFESGRSKNNYFDIQELNYFTTYQVEKLKKMLENDTRPKGFSENELKKYYDLISFQVLIFPKQFSLNSKKLNIFELWFACCYQLKKRNVEVALLWAKKTISEQKHTMPSSNMFSYILIREELSDKNFRVANKLLNDKVMGGDSHYFDDYFYARIELLKGNQEKADRLFKNVYENCLYYSAINRLFFEIDLSCELLKHDIVRWLKNSALLKPKPFKLFKPEEIKDKKVLSQKSVMIGTSDPMNQLKNEIRKYADVNTTILISGETGVGKEGVAQKLHASSEKAHEPFLVINCGAISESLLYSELFGHVKGAYTGAIKDHLGVFEAAGLGVVVLDEIGEITEKTQVALLRVLELKEVKPLGSSKTIKVKCKILAATNKNLKLLVEQGLFREDLYYRLNRLEIQVPSLRERAQDIILLAEYFLKIDREDDEQPQLSKTLKNYLIQHPWPGNIRQLKNEIDKLRLIHSEKLLYDLADFEKTPISQLVKKSKTIKEESGLKSDLKDKKGQNLFDHMQTIIDDGLSPLRRIELIRDLFSRHNHLTRGEIIKLLKVSPNTITNDLKKLIKESFVEKIEPSKSPRTHYFQIKK